MNNNTSLYFNNNAEVHNYNTRSAQLINNDNCCQDTFMSTAIKYWKAVML